MSDTVPNAFLILLGQIGLFVVAFIYGLPLSFLNGEIKFHAFGIEAFTFTFAITLASFMMVANILIGWTAVRDARAAEAIYPKSLFVIDLLVIFVLFGMNNIIIYALGADFSAFDPSSVSKVINEGITAEKTSFTVFILMLMTALYLYLCSLWNEKYLEIKNRTDSTGKSYQKTLRIVIAVIVILAFVSILFKYNHFVTIFCVSAWGLLWIFVNHRWILSEEE